MASGRKLSHHGGWNPGKRALICLRGGKGVGLDYRNHRCRSVWGNMRSATEQHAVLDEHLQKEREANRLRGPCRREEWPNVQASPMGVIPKSEPGRWWLIVDLSPPKELSVNDGILGSLSYL